MNRSNLLSILLLALGVVVLVWGFNASESAASEISEALEGAPSNKSIALIIVGAVLAIVGVVGLFRRAR